MIVIGSASCLKVQEVCRSSKVTNRIFLAQVKSKRGVLELRRQFAILPSTR